MTVSDALGDPPVTVANWLRRHRELMEGRGLEFSGLCLLFDRSGAAGWSGWLPYRDRERTWQSSTYLAPRLRGTGLMALLRCDQVHRAVNLRARLGGAAPAFVSSIATDNPRSLAASRAYAADTGWANWAHTVEREAGRLAWVLEWPALPAPHACFLA